MFRSNSATAWAILLIGGGILLLLDNLNVLAPASSAYGLTWAALFACAGLILLGTTLRDPTQWWMAIPGVILLSLATIIAVSLLLPKAPGPWLGSIFLGGTGLAFLVVYVARPRFWWAIIPCGALLTLAIIAGTADLVDGNVTAAILFLGLALTFGVLYLLPNTSGQTRWAIWPAGGLLLASIALAAGQAALLGSVQALVLIAAGIFLVYRAWGRRQA